VYDFVIGLSVSYNTFYAVLGLLLFACYILYSDRGLAASADVWLRATKMKISAAPWANFFYISELHCDPAVCHVQKSYNFKKENGDSVEEDVSADVKDNYVQYHLKDDDSEIWVIDDFNRVSTDLSHRRVSKSVRKVVN